MRGGDLEMLKRAVVLLKRERDNYSVKERGFDWSKERKPVL